jgi:hypothetical protein
MSLHTSVLYSSTDTKSFCTVSECLQHGPDTILTFTKENNSIDTFHIVSDGPTSQCRSKTNFYLFHIFIHEKHAFKLSTWNFTEAGHGISAADGIGGVVKRTAERLVSQGNDITTAKDLFKYPRECNIDVNLYLVSQSDVENISSSVPTCLPGVKNTMKLHQVISIQGENRIHIRTLSCFCSWPMVCDCYKFENDASYHVFPEYEYESQSVHLNEPSTNCPSITESYYDGSSAGTESNPHSLSNAVINPDPELINKWCVIKCDGQLYPGRIQDIDSDPVEVKCMHRIGENRYFCPLIDDTIWYLWNNVVRIIPEPINVTRRHVQILPSVWREIDN